MVLFGPVEREQEARLSAVSQQRSALSRLCGRQPGGRTPSPPMKGRCGIAIKRRKWEYRIVDIPGGQQTKKWRQYRELLNELGQEGWELVSSADRRAHLKREAEPTPADKTGEAEPEA